MKNKKQKNNIKTKINKEISKSNLRISELEKEIDKHNKYLKKALVIKNLKIFGSTCNFLLPYILSTGLTISFCKSINMGYPFVIDDFNKYKTYSLNYETDELIEYKENYEYNIDPDNILKIVTPWKLNKELKYERVVKEYDVENIEDKTIIDKLLLKDIEYIDLCYNSKEISKEFTNQQFSNNDYIIKADIKVMDKDQFISVKETDKENIYYTIIECISSSLLGTIYFLLRKFKFKKAYKDIISEYQYSLNYLYKLENELTNEKEKVRTLMKENNRSNRNGDNNG